MERAMRLTRRAFGGALSASAVLASSSPAIVATGHRKGRLHLPRYGPAICNDGTRAIISGGAPVGAGRAEEHFYSSLFGVVEAIHPVALDQQSLANAIFHRANHASVWMDGRIWLLGGRTREGTDGRLVSETERVDPETRAIWRGPDLPVPLIHLSAVTLGSSIFVFGGVFRPAEAPRSQASAKVWECAPPYDRWEPRASMPTAVGNAAAVVVQDRVVLIGGYDQERALAITQVYDPKSDEWTVGIPPPIPLSAHAAAGYGRGFSFLATTQIRNPCSASTQIPGFGAASMRLSRPAVTSELPQSVSTLSSRVAINPRLRLRRMLSRASRSHWPTPHSTKPSDTIRSPVSRA